MPVNLLVIRDDAIELKSDEFEKRKVSLQFTTAGLTLGGPAVLDFNISLANAVLTVNAAVKINGVEIQRYSLSNQTPQCTHEVFPQSVMSVANTMEFEIVDTPMSETGIVKISDIVIWLQTQ